MNILLADDERLVRLSIRNMIEELIDKNLFPPVEIEEASNGSELERKVKSFHPHLAFVDIRMPGKSGLEAVESLHGRFTETCWALLTGFAEFSYAKQAIDFGVIDYLVKPPSPADILRTLERARTLLEGRAKTLRYAAGRRMRSIYNGTLSSEFDPWFSGRCFFGGILFPDRLAAGKEFRAGLLKGLEKILEQWNLEWLPAGVICEVLFSDGGRPILFVSTPGRGPVYSEVFDSCNTVMQTAGDVSGGTWKGVFQSDSAEQLCRLLRDAEESFTELELEKRSRNDSGEEVSLRRREQVERAIELVNEQFCSEIGLAQIADELDLTPNYLSTEFKRFAGVNFTEYITELRMKHSLTLLKKPGMSVKQAASALGYVSSRYFSRLFISYYGKKPSAYIESVRR